MIKDAVDILNERIDTLLDENSRLRDANRFLESKLSESLQETERLHKALEEIQATDNFLEIWDIAKETLKQEK